MKNHITSIAWGFILLSLVLAGISTQLHLTFQNSTEIAGHAFLVTAIIQFVLQIGSAVLFVIGLQDFKPEFKHAYLLLVVGIILNGLGRLQVPLFQIFNLWNTEWVFYGGIELVFMVAQVLLFCGMRSFAQLLKIHTRLLSWRILVLFSIFSLLIIFIPHQAALPGRSEFAFSTFSIFSIEQILLGVWSFALAFKIKQNTSPAYTSAMAWLFLAFIFCVIGAFQTLVLNFIGFNNIYVTSGILMVPHILSGAIFLKAGLAFTTISKY